MATCKSVRKAIVVIHHCKQKRTRHTMIVSLILMMTGHESFRSLQVVTLYWTTCMWTQVTRQWLHFTHWIKWIHLVLPVGGIFLLFTWLHYHRSFSGYKCWNMSMSLPWNMLKSYIRPNNLLPGNFCSLAIHLFNINQHFCTEKLR